MRWVVKIAESAGQKRITLPKAFCRKNNINQGDYLVINDRDPERITIGRLIHGKDQQAESV
ncbi:hypothetical protein ES703_17294 [subsurface metagenome]